jgi:lysyl-tRNA synthetase class 2
MSWRPTASIATLEVRAAMLRATREIFQAIANGRPGFLQTSPEYAMKRLLAAGCGDIWQISKVYRDGESGRWHNPEFTMIEWYRVGYDHHSLMSDVERLISAVLPASRQFDRAERLTYREAMQLHAGVDVFQDSTRVCTAPASRCRRTWRTTAMRVST